MRCEVLIRTAPHDIYESSRFAVRFEHRRLDTMRMRT